jgi:glutaredoxin
MGAAVGGGVVRRRLRWVLALAALSAALGAGATACKRSSAAGATADPEAVPVVVKADTEGLLLTWIDDKGDFHVETRVADVPLMGRDAVRVVDPNKDEGTHADRIFVVDLRQARPDGVFPVRTMTRADFEALAVGRREKTGPTLASAAPSQPSPSSQPAENAPPGEPAPGSSRAASKPVVIIYGAEWCGACHDAARYLRSKGIAYVEKDVEKDASAAREMQQKLSENGLRSGSIPVIDVRGKVMVGFNPHEVDSALGAAL